MTSGRTVLPARGRLFRFCGYAAGVQPADLTDDGPSVGATLDAESAEWVRALRGDGTERDEAVRRLHAMMLRACRAETARRSRHGLGGAELDDVANQAADDATIAVLRKMSEFRGDSRFTTWAYKFAMFEVSGKLGRHYWRNATPTATEHDWNALRDRLSPGPDELSQSKALLDALRRAVAEELTPHQRDLFVAVVVDAVPLDAVVARYGTSRNAVYKTVFDARRKIRRYLVTNGWLDESTDGVRR